MRSKIKEEVYQEWLNQPPIHFPLCTDSPIRNDYNNTSSSSEVGNVENKKDIGIDD
jgi:hypothetical protein